MHVSKLQPILQVMLQLIRAPYPLMRVFGKVQGALSKWKLASHPQGILYSDSLFHSLVWLVLRFGGTEFLRYRLILLLTVPSHRVELLRGLSLFKLAVLSACVLDCFALLFGDALRVTHYFFPFLLMYM